MKHILISGNNSVGKGLCVVVPIGEFEVLAVEQLRGRMGEPIKYCVSSGFIDMKTAVEIMDDNEPQVALALYEMALRNGTGVRTTIGTKAELLMMFEALPVIRSAIRALSERGYNKTAA